MSWEHVAQATGNRMDLDLYKSGCDFMIKSGSLELMNSRHQGSEVALAEVATWCVCTMNPKVLIGGLGLGYTFHAFKTYFPGNNHLTVAEISSDVIRWYQDFFRKDLFHCDATDEGPFVNSDLGELLKTTEKKFDIIACDIDNGPVAIFGEKNNYLYSSEGLSLFKSRLTPNGALLLWSSFFCHDFVSRAKKAGFSVSLIPVRFGRSGLHFIYCCLVNGDRSNHEFIQAGLYDYYASDYQCDIEFLRRWLGDEQKILEIGIGSGRLASILARDRALYCGVDASASMLWRLKQVMPQSLSVEICHATMTDYRFCEKFQRIFFPFRILSYAQSDEEIVAALACAKSHLADGGRILVNMIQFYPEFVARWNGQSVEDDFMGPFGVEWQKSDHMSFPNQKTMARKIKFFAKDVVNLVEWEVEDTLRTVSPSELSKLGQKAGLKVCNIWPAYEFKQYTQESEYIIEFSA